MPPEPNLGLGHSHGLLPFLKHACQNCLPTIRNGVVTDSPIYVLGNQSADLDSMISAILYSYFFSRKAKEDNAATNKRRRYVPLVNLPDVRSGAELRRLRPEFACAFELSVSTAASLTNSAPDDASSSSSSSASKEAENGKLKKHADEQKIVRLLKEHILTVADLREGLVSLLNYQQQQQQHQNQSDTENFRQGNGSNTKLNLDCVMVDWNNLSHQPQEKSDDGKYQGQGSIDGLVDLVSFKVTGCIDHRPDEGFVPPSNKLPSDGPRVILSGPGSCASLIVREVRGRGLWPMRSAASGNNAAKGDQVQHQLQLQEQEQQQDDDNSSEYPEINPDLQAAKLALAPILIDTSDLTAEGKVTDIDRDAVQFLTGIIIASSNPCSAAAADDDDGDPHKGWDRHSFYTRIQHVKANSLNWLTVEEMLGRDYKRWTDSMPAGNNANIGIASVVRPLNWIMRKATESKHGGHESSSLTAKDDLEPFLRVLRKFAVEKELDVVAVMTAFSSADGDSEKSQGQGQGQFARELLVWSLQDGFNASVTKFAQSAKKKLNLQQWHDFPEQGELPNNSKLYIWRQVDVSQSRKQVAPLLRGALTR